MIGDRRLVVVTGKGGVGRTTVAAALGLAAARAGRRTAVVELSGLAALPGVLGLPGRSYGARPAAPGLDVMSLTAIESMADFGQRKLGLGGLVRLILGSRLTSSFLEAVPGFQDIVQLGKIENMISEPLAGETRYDLVVLDGPATGHGLTLLSAARAMGEMTRVGPFHDLAGIIERFLSDPTRTAIVPVTLAEELPVHETLELAQGLGAEQRTLGAVVVNQVARGQLPARGWEDVRSALGRSPASRPWAAMAERAIDGLAEQQEVLDHLRSSLVAITGMDLPLVELPRLDPRNPGALVAPLADRLGGIL